MNWKLILKNFFGNNWTIEFSDLNIYIWNNYSTKEIINNLLYFFFISFKYKEEVLEKIFSDIFMKSQTSKINFEVVFETEYQDCKIIWDSNKITVKRNLKKQIEIINNIETSLNSKIKGILENNIDLDIKYFLKNKLSINNIFVQNELLLVEFNNWFVEEYKNLNIKNILSVLFELNQALLEKEKLNIIHITNIDNLFPEDIYELVKLLNIVKEKSKNIIIIFNTNNIYYITSYNCYYKKNKTIKSYDFNNEWIINLINNKENLINSTNIDKASEIISEVFNSTLN